MIHMITMVKTKIAVFGETVIYREGRQYHLFNKVTDSEAELVGYLHELLTKMVTHYSYESIFSLVEQIAKDRNENKSELGWS